MKTLIGLSAAAMLLAGCAEAPSHISAAYVSPLKYASYDCDQIAQEQAGVDERYNVLTEKLKGRETHDKVMMGVGLFVAWPALLFMHGNNGEENAEYAELKGDHDALTEAAIQKKCITVSSSSAPTPAPAPATQK